MGDQTFDDYLKTRAICLTVGDVGKLEEEVIRYMRESWGEAVRQEREQACKLADALMELLRDTQHAKHPSCTDGGYCPVRDAREALDAFTNRIEGTGAAAIRARSEQGGER